MKRIAVAVALLGAGCGLAYPQSGEPIKIVGSLDLSGGAAVPGNDTLLGVQFAVETLNKHGGVLGRPVEFKYQDNGTNPQRAVNQATALIEAGVALLIAPQSSANTLALTKTVSAKLKVPMCVSASGTDDVTMRDFQPYVFSLTPNVWFDMKADAAKLSKMPYKRYALIGADYAGARVSINRFKEFLKEARPDVEFVVEEYPKLGSVDYTATINKIVAAKPDYVASIFYGNDLLTFVKQATALGFFKQIDNRFNALYDETTLRNLGESAPVGTDGMQRAPAAYLAKGTPKSIEFLQEFTAKHGNPPGDWTTMAYDCVITWAQAVTMAKTTDADAVMKAIEAGEFDTMRGRLRFGKNDHQAEVPSFIGKIEYNKEVGRAVMNITNVIPGKDIRPSDEVLKKSRQSQ
jgi:branched-chain amino acid transport system substrate-binding protein